jgi:hypothetical protein
MHSPLDTEAVCTLRLINIYLRDDVLTVLVVSQMRLDRQG